MIRHLPMVFKNSLRNRRRSLLTIVSIAASLCLLGVLMAIYQAFYHAEETPDQALRLVTRNRISLANPLPYSYRAQILQVPGVKEAMVFQWFGGTYKDARDPANFFARFAVEPSRFLTVYPDYKFIEGDPQAFANERQACIVGRKTAQKQNFKIGDRIQIKGDIFPVDLEFVLRGIYDSKLDSESLYFNFDYLNESLASLPGRKDQIGTFLVRIERPEDANSVSKSIDDAFHNAPAQTKTETEAAFGLSFLAFLGNVKLILLSISSAVTFTILLVTGNTMAMTVRERVREVGVLKTLGFTNGLVVSVLVGEAIVISLLGGIIGLLFASGLCALLRTLPSTFANLSQIGLPPPVIALCLSIAVLIGIVSSLFPAWSASRRSIVEALKFND